MESTNEQHNKEAIIRRVQTIAQREISFEKESFSKELEILQSNKSISGIKVVSVLGGFLATLAFLGFLLVSGFYDSGIALVILGAILTIGSISLNRVYDSLVIGSFSVTSYIAGFALLATGLMMEDVNEKGTVYLLMIAAVVALFLTRNYILTFLSVLALGGFCLTLIFLHDIDVLIPTYINVLAGLTTAMFLSEARIRCWGQKANAIYSPVRSALVFSLLVATYMLNRSYVEDMHFFWELSASALPFVCILFLIRMLLQKLASANNARTKTFVWIVSIAMLLPTVFAPGILVALLLLLLSYYTRYMTGLVLAVLAFIYFTSVFYYDLNVSLLGKSVLLICSGLLFLLLYFVTKRNLKSDEE